MQDHQHNHPHIHPEEPINAQEETEGGLLVPSHSLNREQETWIKEDVKKMDKLVKFAKSKEAEIIMVCQKCGKPLQVLEREDGRVILRCKHKDRVLKRDI